MQHYIPPAQQRPRFFGRAKLPTSAITNIRFILAAKRRFSTKHTAAYYETRSTESKKLRDAFTSISDYFGKRAMHLKQNPLVKILRAIPLASLIIPGGGVINTIAALGAEYEVKQEKSKNAHFITLLAKRHVENHDASNAKLQHVNKVTLNISALKKMLKRREAWKTAPEPRLSLQRATNNAIEQSYKRPTHIRTLNVRFPLSPKHATQITATLQRNIKFKRKTA